MDPKVLVALIMASTSLLVSVVGFLWTRRNDAHLAKLKADLTERNARKSALMEYEYEARKRLYRECGPLLFGLSEAAERALGRIARLAQTARAGNLEPGSASWLRRGYFNRSTYYRLFAPLAFGRILQGKLTHLDLSLDPSIHWQYMLCKQLADTFTDDFDFAGYKPTLEYHPHDPEAETRRADKPEEYWQQGVPRGILENAVSTLIREDQEQTRAVIGFAEFEVEMEDRRSQLRANFERISYLFQDFHPGSRPVLWRVLLAQAHLYQALICAREENPGPKLWNDIWAKDAPDFDWAGTVDGLASEPQVGQSIHIGMEYARHNTISLLKTLNFTANQTAG